MPIQTNIGTNKLNLVKDNIEIEQLINSLNNLITYRMDGGRSCDLGKQLRLSFLKTQTLIESIQKTDCGKILCLSNQQCDHFTWSPVDNKCWLKKWYGNGPTVNNIDSLCGFIPSRVTDPSTLTVTINRLVTIVTQLKSQLNGKIFLVYCKYIN
jgi:hypothetical protein